MGKNDFGIDPAMLVHYSKQIKEIVDLGVEVAIVIGGGNIFRGLQAEASGIERVQGCLLYTSPSPRDATLSRMPSSA